MHQFSRICVIGAAGVVGSSVAAQLAAHGLGQELYLQDIRENLVEAHRIDISDAQALLGLDEPQLFVGAAPAGTADLVIVAASLPENPRADRREFLQGNAGLLRGLAPSVHEQLAPEGVVLLLSNPVDILADWMTRTLGFSETRLIGYSLNDAARFRAAVADELGMRVSHIDAMVLGEHGRGQVPVFSSVRVNGRAVEWRPAQKQRLEEHMAGWFGRYLALNSGRSSGWASGFGVMKLVRELEHGQQVITTVSTRGIPQLPETYTALPVRWSGQSMRAELPALDRGELELLRQVARSTRAAADELEST
ncbi:malate dehydrogenase [Nesterenkonia flava]|uniref:Lactate dehydrogenase n=1 Tax=Nesterenkonia flava TaxID=469799 RepID=A0ABU1FPM8_9MICC|nr:hypothetical protein [Nesterenkonia flava]MDR5710604.1 hypothetical protein [Nesterenkonia flava]